MDNTFAQAKLQTGLLQKQAQAALEAVITKQFMVAGREDKPYLRIVLTNRGRVAASSVQADFQLTLVSLADKGNIAGTGVLLPDWKFSIPEIPQSIDSVSERGIYLGAVHNELASSPKIRRAIKLTGALTYFNGFQDRSDPVCYYIINALQFKNRGGGIQGHAANAILCDELSNQLAWLEENSAPD